LKQTVFSAEKKRLYGAAATAVTCMRIIMRLNRALPARTRKLILNCLEKTGKNFRGFQNFRSLLNQNISSTHERKEKWQKNCKFTNVKHVET
jgi:hypothetical protein